MSWGWFVVGVGLSLWWVCRLGGVFLKMGLSFGWVCRALSLSGGGFVMGKVCLGWVCREMGWSWSGFVGVPLENTLTKTLFWLDLDFNLWYGKFK